MLFPTSNLVQHAANASSPSVRPDPYKCRSIFHGGSWTAPEDRHPYRRWSPDDCRLHEHSRGDFGDCLAGHRVVFVGDSWMRQLYWAAATRLDVTKQQVAVLDFYLEENKQKDLFFDANGVLLEFIWDPWLNSSDFRDQLARFRQPPAHMKFGMERTDSPGLLVVGTPGLWAARHGGDEYMDLFRDGVDQLLPYMKEDLDSVVMSQPRQPSRATEWLPNQLHVVPVPIPSYKRLTRPRRASITPDKITAMNSYLRRWPDSAQTRIPWVFNQMVEGDPDAYNEDGIHLEKDVRERALSVLLNERCNAGLKPDLQRSGSLGCVSHERPGLVQICVLILCVVTAALLVVKREDTALTATVEALAPLAFAGLMSYLIERTHVFIKVDRLWDGTAATAVFMAFCAASVVSVRHTTQGGEARFMPREHTDEWKGWLQTLVLLLSYFDGGSSLIAHKALRLAAASYIFLSTYGHATYFLTTGDYSPRRAAAVILRLNLLNCLLAFAVDNKFTVHHFTPLISICFLVTYGLFAVKKGSNGDIAVLVGKVVAAALLVNLVVFPAGLLRHAIDFTNTVARSSFDSRKMNEALMKDSIVPFVGMLAACVSHHAARLRGDSPPQPQSRAASLLDKLILRVSSANLLKLGTFRLGAYATLNLTVLISLLALLLPGVVMHDRGRYDDFHRFLAPLVVLPGAYLRSHTPVLRAAHLALPAWLGRIALETYVLHHHVWLAGAGSSVLALWRPSDTPLGMALYGAQKVFLAVVFLSLAAGAHEATRRAVEALLGGGPAEEEDRAERGEKRVKIGVGRQPLVSGLGMRVLVVGGVVWGANMLYEL